MRQLAIDRLDDRMRLAANVNGAREVCRLQRLYGLEDLCPAALPERDQIVSRRIPRKHELHIAVTVWLLSVAVQKIRPARDHITGHVLDDDADAIGLFIKRREKLFVIHLRESFLGQPLIIAKSRKRIIEIVSSEGVVHQSLTSAHLFANGLGQALARQAHLLARTHVLERPLSKLALFIAEDGDEIYAARRSVLELFAELVRFREKINAQPEAAQLVCEAERFID